MATHRHHPVRMTLGVRMALLPAILAAAATFLFAGGGHPGLDIAEALVVGVIVAVAIAIPVDRLGTRPVRTGSGRRRGRR
jgi:hypothetical protein